MDASREAWGGDQYFVLHASSPPVMRGRKPLSCAYPAGRLQEQAWLRWPAGVDRGMPGGGDAEEWHQSGVHAFLRSPADGRMVRNWVARIGQGSSWEWCKQRLHALRSCKFFKHGEFSINDLWGSWLFEQLSSLWQETCIWLYALH
jgi:hypothetical protein